MKKAALLGGIAIFAFADVSASCIDIDVGRQLFVDDWLIASTQGIVRVFNHPVKSFDAPVLWPETDLEREVDPSRPYRFAPVVGATGTGEGQPPTIQ